MLNPLTFISKFIRSNNQKLIQGTKSSIMVLHQFWELGFVSSNLTFLFIHYIYYVLYELVYYVAQSVEHLTFN